MQWDILTAVFDCCLNCIAEATAAGYGHSGHGDRADIVVLKNLRQFFGIAMLHLWKELPQKNGQRKSSLDLLYLQQQWPRLLCFQADSGRHTTLCRS